MPTSEISIKADANLTGSCPAEDKVSLARVRSAYRRLAPIYDQLFGACFKPGQRAAVKSLACQPGENILEVGVGTGLALPLWPNQTSVTGIDVSESMLKRAALTCERLQLSHVKLCLMDAQSTLFPDNHFDKIAAMYVVSVVPSVNALLSEMKRICKPGGHIAIVNHFAHPNPTVNRMERWLSNHAGLIGFNSALPVENVTQVQGLKILRVEAVNWGGYWTLIVAENVK